MRSAPAVSCAIERLISEINTRKRNNGPFTERALACRVYIVEFSACIFFAIRRARAIATVENNSGNRRSVSFFPSLFQSKVRAARSNTTRVERTSGRTKEGRVFAFRFYCAMLIFGNIARANETDGFVPVLKHAESARAIALQLRKVALRHDEKKTVEEKK